MRVRSILVLSSVAVLAAPGAVCAQDVAALRQDTLIASAERAALAWLALIDEGRWEQAWSRMIEMMRNSVSMAEWRATIEQGRAPLQPIGGRRLIAATRLTTFNGSAAVQLVFRVTSASSPWASETVVLSPGPDGWLISMIGIHRDDPGHAAKDAPGAGP